MRIVSLYRYPVKGLRGLEVPLLDFDALGPIGDRRLMIVDERGTFLSQRTVPRMARVGASFEKGVLELRTAGGEGKRFLLVLGALQKVSIWSDTVLAHEVSAEASAFLSEFLGVACRVVQLPERPTRRIDPRYVADERHTGFADAYPLLVTCTASLEALNASLEVPIEMNRFRPNVVIETQTPFEEDLWQTVALENAVLSMVKPCVRCVVVNTDQLTGERIQAPLKTLASVHSLDGFGPVFGMNAVAERHFSLRVGTVAQVVRRRSAAWRKL